VRKLWSKNNTRRRESRACYNAVMVVRHTSAVRAGAAEDAVTSPSKKFMGKID